jgi:hypothetical protein
MRPTGYTLSRFQSLSSKASRLQGCLILPWTTPFQAAPPSTTLRLHQLGPLRRHGTGQGSEAGLPLACARHTVWRACLDLANHDILLKKHTLQAILQYSILPLCHSASVPEYRTKSLRKRSLRKDPSPKLMITPFDAYSRNCP